MRFKNRKGSTLALTIMIFAVLMIFATFTLGFMVTENKQAMYHQNKTQAYYIARSGVEVVEAALKEQLYKYESNSEEQAGFVSQFDGAGVEVDVDIDDLSGKVLIKNEVHNDKKIMTIEAKSSHNGVESTVKKGLFSILTVVNQTEENEYIIGGGELFVVLGDDKPKEFYGNGKSGTVPENYYNMVDPEIRSDYDIDPFIPVAEENWAISNEIVVANKITSGTYSSEDKDIFVNGSLELSGNIQINGDLNIHVKDTLNIRNSTYLTSDTYTTETGKKYRLNIYVYNTGNATTSVSTDSSADIRFTGNLHVVDGDISIEVHQDGYIDGSIIYTGDGMIDFSSHSNNFTSNKLLTGSIYAPYATVNLGIHTYKTANIIGGQIIARKIDVYSNNKTQAGKFYIHSTENRENNSIPVKTTNTINYTSIDYDSFFLD